MDSLEMTIAELLRDSEARKRLFAKGARSFERASGATARAAALIHELHSEAVAAEVCPI